MHTDTPRKSCTSHTQLMCSLYMNHTTHRVAEIAPRRKTACRDVQVCSLLEDVKTQHAVDTQTDQHS
jgi:hypothetical protein